MQKEYKLVLMNAKELIIFHSDNTNEILLASVKNNSFEFYLYENVDLDFLCFKAFNLAKTPNKHERIIKFNNSILLRNKDDINCLDPIRIVIKDGKFDVQSIKELERNEISQEELDNLILYMSGLPTRLIKSKLVKVVQGEKYDRNRPLNF